MESNCRWHLVRCRAQCVGRFSVFTPQSVPSPRRAAHHAEAVPVAGKRPTHGQQRVGLTTRAPIGRVAHCFAVGAEISFRKIDEYRFTHDHLPDRIGLRALLCGGQADRMAVRPAGQSALSCTSAKVNLMLMARARPKKHPNCSIRSYRHSLLNLRSG